MHRWVKAHYFNSCTHVQLYISLWKCFTTEEHDVCTYTVYMYLDSILDLCLLGDCLLLQVVSFFHHLVQLSSGLGCFGMFLMQFGLQTTKFVQSLLLTSLLLFEEGRYTHELLNSIAYISTERKWISTVKCTAPNSKVHSLCALFGIMQWLYSNQCL